MDRTSLLSRESWRLYVGLALVLLGSVLMFAGKAFGVEGNELEFTLLGCAGASVGFLWLLLMPTCPRCRFRLFPHAISTQPASGWLKWLLSNPVCPHCGFRHDP
jgi:hypothetical protein